MTTLSEEPPYLLDANVLFRALYTTGAVAHDVLLPLEPAKRRLLLGYGTLWETMAKVHRGKKNLQQESLKAELDVIRALRIRLIPITVGDVLSSIALPGIHRDPFDRMLVAQAQRLGAKIVSSDRILADYGVPVVTL